MGAEVWRPKEGRPFSAWWFCPRRWRFVRRSTGQRTQAAALAVARRWREEGEQIRSGILPPAAREVRRSLTEHVADFLRAKRNSPRQIGAKHIRETEARINRIVAETGWTSLTEVTKDGFLAALARVGDAPAPASLARKGVKGLSRRARRTRDGTLSNASRNAYRAAWKSLTRWLHQSGRIPADPLASVEKFQTQGRETFRRRRLTEEELDALESATRRGPSRRGIAPEDRWMLYLVAVSTGFRAEELSSLTPASFRLDGAHPFVALGAECSKNGKPCRQPLPPAIVDGVAAWLAGKPPKSRIWPELTDATAQMLYSDLEAAGVPVETDDGRADFHALRHTYITMLTMGGVPVPVAMQLARHSDSNLTLRYYSHVTTAELAKHVGAVSVGACRNRAHETGRSDPVRAADTEAVQSGAHADGVAQPETPQGDEPQGAAMNTQEATRAANASSRARTLDPLIKRTGEADYESAEQTAVSAPVSGRDAGIVQSEREAAGKEGNGKGRDDAQDPAEAGFHAIESVHYFWRHGRGGGARSAR